MVREDAVVERRRAPLALAGALAAALAIGALGWPAGASAGHPRDFFGVNASSTYERDFSEIARRGARSVRTLFNWRFIQRSRRGFGRWGQVDAFVRVAARNRVRVHPFVYGTPQFLTSHGSVPPLRSTLARREWRRFLRTLVRRYGPGGRFWLSHPFLPRMPIRTWEIWNEPGSAFYWRPRPNPREYAMLLRMSARTIRSLDRNARIVVGGINDPRRPGSIGAADFLRGLYSVPGVRGDFDRLALHPYGRTTSGVQLQVEAARAVMNARGDRSTPIWVSEIGWGSNETTHPLTTTRVGQALKLRRAFRMFIRNRRRLGVQRVFWYSWRDRYDRRCLFCRSTGLVTADGTPKPALPIFTSLVHGH